MPVHGPSNPTIPDRFPATGTDMGVNITRSVTHHRIGMRLVFDERLDERRLSRAARLAMDAEPILGCAWVHDVSRPYWSRLPDLDSASAFTFVRADDPAASMDSFQATEIEDTGPLAKVVLLRGREHDEVGFKVSHVLADGQAAKQYAYLVADLYGRLAADAGYRPAPNLNPRPTAADVWEHLTPQQRTAAKQAKSWSNPTWEVPSRASDGQGPTYRAATLTPDEFVRLREYGHCHGVTVNDVMITAVFRACVDAFDPPVGVAHSLMCTADLRRYLPDVETLPISNISISGSTDIERVAGENFENTLRRMHERIRAWADTCYGAWPAYRADGLMRNYPFAKALMGLMFRLTGASNKTYPFFTNIGILDHERLTFDGVLPVSGYMYGPVAKGASIVAVISTFRDALTVNLGFCASDMDERIVGRVLESTLDGVRRCAIFSECEPTEQAPQP